MPLSAPDLPETGVMRFLSLSIPNPCASTVIHFTFVPMFVLQEAEYPRIDVVESRIDLNSET